MIKYQSTFWSAVTNSKVLKWFLKVTIFKPMRIFALKSFHSPRTFLSFDRIQKYSNQRELSHYKFFTLSENSYSIAFKSIQTNTKFHIEKFSLRLENSSHSFAFKSIQTNTSSRFKKFSFDSEIFSHSIAFESIKTNAKFRIKEHWVQNFLFFRLKRIQ